MNQNALNQIILASHKNDFHLRPIVHKVEGVECLAIAGHLNEFIACVALAAANLARHPKEWVDNTYDFEEYMRNVKSSMAITGLHTGEVSVEQIYY